MCRGGWKGGVRNEDGDDGENSRWMRVRIGGGKDKDDDLHFGMQIF